MVVCTRGDDTAITGLFPATSEIVLLVLSAISTTQMAKPIRKIKYTKLTNKHQEERYKKVKTKL